jgi:hypothetical protein
LADSARDDPENDRTPHSAGESAGTGGRGGNNSPTNEPPHAINTRSKRHAAWQVTCDVVALLSGVTDVVNSVIDWVSRM